MKCYNCKKTLEEKPWIIYGNEDESIKNICGYLCSRRCPDITSYNRSHILNPEDFDEYRLSPILPQKEDLKLLTLAEISRMNNVVRGEYEVHLERMFAIDEDNIKKYEDHMEIEHSYKEQESYVDPDSSSDEEY